MLEHSDPFEVASAYNSFPEARESSLMASEDDSSIDLVIHWHGLSCCEIQTNRRFESLLFRQLAFAASELRSQKVADGAVSSYGSIAAYWQTAPDDPLEAANTLRSIARASLALSSDDLPETRSEHEISVIYDGPDLTEVADFHKLDPLEIIRRHSHASYTVAAVGFMPNFAYLWGMDSSLATPRRSSPRVRVPEGSVGIAGSQTGIYPMESPGGWQLIGQVDPVLCNQICPQLKVGDTVRFRASTP